MSGGLVAFVLPSPSDPPHRATKRMSADASPNGATKLKRTTSFASTLSDLITSFPTPTRRKPELSPRPTVTYDEAELAILLSKITLKDIQKAERCGSGGFGDVSLLRHRTLGRIALKRLRCTGNQKEVSDQHRVSTTAGLYLSTLYTDRPHSVRPGREKCGRG